MTAFCFRAIFLASAFILSAAFLAAAFAFASAALVFSFYLEAAALMALVSDAGALAAFNDSKPAAIYSLTALTTVSVAIAGVTGASNNDLVGRIGSIWNPCSFLALASSFFLAASAFNSACFLSVAAFL